jgi:hypothetical protein
VREFARQNTNYAAGYRQNGNNNLSSASSKGARITLNMAIVGVAVMVKSFIHY